MDSHKRTSGNVHLEPALLAGSEELVLHGGASDLCCVLCVDNAVRAGAGGGIIALHILLEGARHAGMEVAALLDAV